MRLVCTLLMACVAASAWAQGRGTDTSPTRERAEREAELDKSRELQNLIWREQAGVPMTEAEKAVQSVVDAITRKDCPAAVTRLNAGLGKAYPEVLSLAGAMYEDGLCLKPNWDRALTFYQRAITAGHPGAAARVAAGYAAPAGGRDLATALWWSVRAKTALPAPCARVAPLADDADKFVAALNAWPAGQLGACTYAAAVMATIQAEVESANLAGTYGVEGKLKFVLVPEQGRVDISQDLKAAATLPGATIDAVARERGFQDAKVALSTTLREVADRALKRYDKPAGIAPDWRSEAEFALKVTR
jgi:TPR repeat protein